MFLIPTLLFSCVIGTIAAYIDIKTRTIPNILTFLLGIINLLLLFFLVPELKPHLQSFLILLLLGIGSFKIRLFGGGDIKLILAIGILIPIQYFSTWILLILSIGGIQAFIAYFQEQKTLPYGVAICIGSWIYLFWIYLLLL